MKTANTPPVPTGIQVLLRLASADEGFRAKLVATRSMAAHGVVELCAGERAILDAIPAAQLERMAASLPADRRGFLLQAAASAAGVLGVALDACSDKPQPSDTPDAAPPEPSPTHTADGPATAEAPPPPPQRDGGAAKPDAGARRRPPRTHEEPPPRPIQVPVTFGIRPRD